MLNSEIMERGRLIFVIFGVICFVIGIGLFLVGFFKPTGAGILVEATPKSLVYLDGLQVGYTPYEAVREPSEVTVKLVPEVKDVATASFETKVNLVSGVKTIVRRNFGASDETSSGEIISYEKIGGGDASFAVVSIPDAAQVVIGGSLRAFAPYKTSGLTAGEHGVIVSAAGYNDESLTLNAVPGYRLTLVVKLASSSQKVLTEVTPAPSEIKVTIVEILPTPTNFLRVRSDPGLAGTEVGQVKPGQKFAVLAEDAATGWYKIGFEKGKVGWVTNQYTKKSEETLSIEEAATLGITATQSSAATSSATSKS
jgi:hypothetical protein